MKILTWNARRIQNIFNQRFPEYVALSKPQPLTVEQTQALLADDEALVDFDFDAHSYAWVITRTSADWTELKISAKDLTEQVEQLRQSLTFDVDKPFDAALAHNIYQETIGAIAEKLEGKKRLSVVTNGALTSLPLQLLVTQDPTRQIVEGYRLARPIICHNGPAIGIQSENTASAVRDVGCRKANDRLC